MKSQNPITSRRVVLITALLLLLLVACVPQRQGVSWAAISELDGNILVAYNDYMVLVDPANGRPVQLRNAEGEIRTDEEGVPRRWIVQGSETGSEFYTSPIVMDDETLITTDYNEKLVTIDRVRAVVQTGFQIELPSHVIADPVQSEELFYVSFNDQDLIAYSIGSYSEVWRFETDRGIWDSPLLHDGILYIPGMGHHLYAVNAQTGEEIWTADLNGAIASTPLLVDNRLFVGTFGRQIVEVSLDGAIVNEYDTDNWVWGTPVHDDGIIYAADLSGSVYALSIENGLTEVWKERASESGIRPSPLVVNDYVIVADRSGRVRWLDRSTGSQFEDFTQDAGNEILSELLYLEPAGLEPLVIVSTVNNNNVLVAYSLDAVPRWSYGR